MSRYRARQEFALHLSNADYEAMVKTTPLRLWQHVRGRDGTTIFNVATKDVRQFYDLANRYIFVDAIGACDLWGEIGPGNIVVAGRMVA